MIDWRLVIVACAFCTLVAAVHLVNVLGISTGNAQTGFPAMP